MTHCYTFCWKCTIYNGEYVIHNSTDWNLMTRSLVYCLQISFLHLVLFDFLIDDIKSIKVWRSLFELMVHNILRKVRNISVLITVICLKFCWQLCFCVRCVYKNKNIFAYCGPTSGLMNNSPLFRLFPPKFHSPSQWITMWFFYLPLSIFYMYLYFLFNLLKSY